MIWFISFVMLKIKQQCTQLTLFNNSYVQQKHVLLHNSNYSQYINTSAASQHQLLWG